MGIDGFRGCLLGLACGDAVGTTLEFKARGTFKPIDDMEGGGPFGLQPGQWTDDTSMALCLATSLIECDGFDARDQMERYCRWWRDGYLSSTGRCFDIGVTTSAALQRFLESGEPFAGSDHPRSAGNGSIMRLAPVALFYFPDQQSALRYAADSSRTTHGATECLDACRLLTLILFRCLAGCSKDEITAPVEDFQGSERIVTIASGGYRGKTESEIRGTGYTVDCLEAALWCFSRTDSFRSAVLAAANLGDDADTTAAVCGQIAGAHYGERGIPEDWLKKLAICSEIRDIADRLHRVRE